ncbi:MAG: class I SAM-dependent methyltransferase [Flavobacteriaceae bacterium]
MEENSCNISDKGKSCCSVPEENKIENLSTHWDNAYNNSPEEKLGWFETDLSPMLQLINKTGLGKSATILNAGAGSTTLIDALVKNKFSNIIATDLSKVALNNLSSRVGKGNVTCIVDDLTNPIKLNTISPVDLWIDRAVLHFFTDEKDQKSYFDLINQKVTKGGFVILAEFSLEGAQKCSGLDVKRYSKETLSEKLGADFELIDSFDFIYQMPSGAERPYIYTLFRKK